MPPSLTQIVDQLKQSWQRYLIAATCVFLVVARMIFPALNVDWISVVLIAIATAACLTPRLSEMLPHVVRALPYVKKAKVFGVEIELSEEIKTLSIHVEDAKESLSSKTSFLLVNSFETAQSEVLNLVKTDSRAALMILAARIEQTVAIRLASHGLREQGTEIPMRRAMELGVEHGVFPAQVIKPFQEFWELRNRVAHGRAFEVDDALLLSLVSVGLEVLKLVSLEERNGSSN